MERVGRPQLQPPVTPTNVISNPFAAQLSVVMADDVAEIQTLVKHWLSEAGHLVRCASSGREVAQLVRQQHVDLIITDILMPDEDGLSVIMDAKRTHPEARLLAISGGGLHLQASDCLLMAKALGAHDVLLKPFNREQLLSAVSRVIQSGV